MLAGMQQCNNITIKYYVLLAYLLLQHLYHHKATCPILALKTSKNNLYTFTCRHILQQVFVSYVHRKEAIHPTVTSPLGLNQHLQLLIIYCNYDLTNVKNIEAFQ